MTVWHLGLYFGLQGQRWYYKILASLCLGTALIALGAWFLNRPSDGHLPGKLIAFGTATIVFIAGALLLLSSNALSTALIFSLSIVAVALLLLLNGAAFLMVATIIIYAGAIVVTFLFVLMLAQQRGPTRYDSVPREPLLACFAGWALSLCVVVVLAIPRDGNHQDAGGSKLINKTDDPNRQLIRTIRALDPILKDLVAALESQKPREEIVEILDARAYDGIVFSKAMEELRTPRAWNEDTVILGIRKQMEQSYESLLSSLIKDPPDYAHTQDEIGRLRCILSNFQHTLEGSRVLTAFEEPSTTRGLGKALFGYYAIPVPIAGFILLLATIGTFVVARAGRTN